VFGADGSFRVDDVPAGDYALNIRLRTPARKSGPSFENETTTLGSLEMDVRIQEAPDESNDAVVNLGDLQLRLLNPSEPSANR
jgi:hypothetical protein